MDEEFGNFLSGSLAGFSTSAYSESFVVSTGSALVVEGAAMIFEGQQILYGSLCLFTGISSLGASLGSSKLTQNFNKEQVLNNAIDKMNLTNEEINNAIEEITKTR